jgi:hypothetical protein
MKNSIALFILTLGYVVDANAQTVQKTDQRALNPSMMMQEIRINPKDTAMMQMNYPAPAMMSFILDSNAKIYTPSERDSILNMLKFGAPTTK